MGDLALEWGVGAADLVLGDEDLGADDGLRTAVMLSLFTDRRAESDDPLPSDDQDVRGWWADEFLPTPSDRFGSRLWLLDRSADRVEVPRLAEEYDREALGWLLEDKVTERIDVEVESLKNGWLQHAITIWRPEGPVRFLFEHVWEAEGLNDPSITFTPILPPAEEPEEEDDLSAFTALTLPTHRLEPVSSASPGNTAYLWINTLVAAGWTLRGSGDGLSAYSATDGSAITSGNSGANGFNNALAWMRFRSPDGVREIVLQLITATVGSGTTNGQARIKYSKAAGFTAGSPSATATPDAADEVFLIGSGSSASPVGVRLFAHTTGDPAHAAGHANSVAPYGFAMFTHSNDANYAPSAVLAMDPIVSDLVGATDADPYVFYCHGSITSGPFLTGVMAGTGAVSDTDVCRAFTPSGSWEGHNPDFLDVSGWGFGVDGQDNTDGMFVAAPIYWKNVGSGTRKGQSTLFGVTSQTAIATSAILSLYASADGSILRRYMRLYECVTGWGGLGGGGPGAGWSSVGNLKVLGES